MTKLSSYLIVTDVRERDILPTHFSLSQNYPNPFNPTTTLQFSIPRAGSFSLKVFNVLGQEVADLFDKEMSPGGYSARFDAGKLPSGVYIYTLKGSGVTLSKKMAFLK